MPGLVARQRPSPIRRRAGKVRRSSEGRGSLRSGGWRVFSRCDCVDEVAVEDQQRHGNAHTQAVALAHTGSTPAVTADPASGIRGRSDIRRDLLPSPCPSGTGRVVVSCGESHSGGPLSTARDRTVLDGDRNGLHGRARSSRLGRIHSSAPEGTAVGTKRHHRCGVASCSEAARPRCPRSRCTNSPRASPMRGSRSIVAPVDQSPLRHALVQLRS